MSNSPSVIIVGAGPAEEVMLLTQLEDIVELKGSEANLERAVELAMRHHPHLALLYLDHHPDQAFDVCSSLSRCNGCLTMIVSRDKDPGQILRAMRAGAKEFAHLDHGSAEVRNAVLDLSQRLHTTPLAETKKGEIIAVFSCKGGSGATTIATNLASALHAKGKENGRKTVLLDMNFQMGDVLAFLDLASRYTWRDFIDNMHRLDDELLYNSLTKHSFGLHVISQSDAPEDADCLKAEDLERGLAFLREHFSFVVVDGLRDFSENSLIVIDRADKILITITPDIPALKNAKRCLNIFTKLGYGEDKLKLVLNRYHRRAKLDPDSIADALGMPVAANVANDYPTVIRSINEGGLLLEIAPRGQVTRDIGELASLLDEDAEKPKRGLLNLWRKAR